MSVEENALVLQAACGNTDAFGQLIGKYSNAVYAIAYARTGDFHYAEDIAQDVFVKAWYRLNQLNDPGKFGGWLISIAKNAALDWARRMKPASELAEHHLHSTAVESAEEETIRRERGRMVRAALNRLEEKYRLVAVMYFMSGFNTRQISKLLGISLSAAESRLRRSKEMLKKELFELAEQTLVLQKLGKDFERKVVKRIVGLACINLPVSNVEKSARWYVKHLGCILMREPMRFPQGGAVETDSFCFVALFWKSMGY